MSHVQFTIQSIARNLQHASSDQIKAFVETIDEDSISRIRVETFPRRATKPVDPKAIIKRI